MYIHDWKKANCKSKDKRLSMQLMQLFCFRNNRHKRSRKGIRLLIKIHVTTILFDFSQGIIRVHHIHFIDVAISVIGKDI